MLSVLQSVACCSEYGCAKGIKSQQSNHFTEQDWLPWPVPAMTMPATIADICTKCDKTDRSRMWVLRARHCMCRGFCGKVWKGARGGAKGIATGAKDAACARDTTCDHTARQHPIPLPGSRRGGSRGGIGSDEQGSGWQGGDPSPPS